MNRSSFGLPWSRSRDVTRTCCMYPGPRPHTKIKNICGSSAWGSRMRSEPWHAIPLWPQRHNFITISDDIMISGIVKVFLNIFLPSLYLWQDQLIILQSHRKWQRFISRDIKTDSWNPTQDLSIDIKMWGSQLKPPWGGGGGVPIRKAVFSNRRHLSSGKKTQQHRHPYAVAFLINMLRQFFRFKK